MIGRLIHHDNDVWEVIHHYGNGLVKVARLFDRFKHEDKIIQL